MAQPGQQHAIAQVLLQLGGGGSSSPRQASIQLGLGGRGGSQRGGTELHLPPPRTPICAHGEGQPPPTSPLQRNPTALTLLQPSLLSDVGPPPLKAGGCLGAGGGGGLTAWPPPGGTGIGRRRSAAAARPSAPRWDAALQQGPPRHPSPHVTPSPFSPEGGGAPRYRGGGAMETPCPISFPLDPEPASGA